MYAANNTILITKERNELREKLQRIASLSLAEYPLIADGIEEIEKSINEILNSSFGIFDIVNQQSTTLDIAFLLRDLTNRLQRDGFMVSLQGPTSPAIILCNKTVLNRIFENLITNAIKYGKSADITITMQSDTVTITVDDKGDGIPDHELPHVFELFYRSSNPATANIKGSGVGLAFAKLATTVYQGNITLVNLQTLKIGHGLRVAVTFPLATDPKRTQEIQNKIEQALNQTLSNQDYILKLATDSHDLLNLTTRIRLRCRMLPDSGKKAQIENILDEIDRPMREILKRCKSLYQSSHAQIAAA